MEFSGLGGGIMVALAAGLWLVYLMPSWFKRRDYVASERAEVRRQQALRVLQETTSTPVMQRVESIVTAAGEVRDREKLAEAIRRSKEAQAARAAAVAARKSTSTPVARARMARRLRRTRAVASLLLLASVVTFIVQLVLMGTSGVVPGAWAVLGFSAVIGVVAVAALGRLASMARRRATRPAAKVLRRSMSDPVDVAPAIVEAPVARQGWTPVPVPKPMYLSRSAAAPSAVTADPTIELEMAAAKADRALRDAQKSPEVVPITAPEPVAAPSRFASMGVLDDLELENTNLDEVLRRRRSLAS